MKRRSCNLEKDVSNTSEDYSIGAALGGDPARAANAEGLPKADAPLWLEVPPVERVVLEVFFGKFETRWHPHKLAIFLTDHVGALLVFIEVPISVAGSGREESDTIQRPVALDAIHDLVGMGSPESHGIRLFHSLDRAALAVSVALRIDGIVWALVVVLHVGHVVQSVDNIWTNPISPARVTVAAGPVSALVTAAAVKTAIVLHGARTALGVDWLGSRNWIVERIHGEVSRLEHGHGPCPWGPTERIGRGTEWIGRSIHVAVDHVVHLSVQVVIKTIQSNLYSGAGIYIRLPPSVVRTREMRMCFALLCMLER